VDDEDQLLDAWSSGDTDAGDKLLRLHFNSVYRFFVTKAPDAVDDLIQATFLEALSTKEQFRRESSFRSYLLGIARHQLFRLYRSRSRDRLVFSPNEHSALDTGTTPSAALGRKREEKLLMRAMLSIPVDLQIVLERHYWEGTSTRELAAVLEVPQGTIKSRLRRARKAVGAAIDALTADPELRETTRSCLEHRRPRTAPGD
jgi:RNA polymerase sigma-70 factor (ECF subfamily)